MDTEVASGIEALAGSRFETGEAAEFDTMLPPAFAAEGEAGGDHLDLRPRRTSGHLHAVDG